MAIAVATYLDPVTGSWRNQTSTGDVLPEAYGTREEALAAGRDLAASLGAQHFDLSEGVPSSQ